MFTDTLESRVMFSVGPCESPQAATLPGQYTAQYAPTPCCQHPSPGYTANVAAGYTTPAQYAAWQATIWNAQL